MGRKIPGKKHKGVKDPHLQQARREEILKYQINAPPKDVDFQEIPKSVERLMKLKQMAKEGLFNKLKKKKEKSKKKLMDTSKLTGTEKLLPGMSKPDRTLPRLVQRPTESNKAFLYRVSQATHDFIKEVNFEVKHNMKMKRDDKTGEVKFDKVEVHPVDKMFQERLEAANNRNFKHKNKKNVPELGLSKTARRRLRHQEKSKRLRGEGEEENVKDDYKQLQDKVEFNEVVHRPPQLTVLPRKAHNSDEGVARRPASKPGLLLAKMLSAGGSTERRDLTGKRKDLSMSDRRRLESAQADAISAYRQMKAKRSTSVR